MMPDIRRATDDDLGSIIGPWSQEMRHAPWSRGMPDDLYFPAQKQVIKKLLRRAITLVAADPEDGWHTYGFVTFETAMVHFLYVKDTFRRMGIGRKLLDSAIGGTAHVVLTQPTGGFLRRFDEQRRVGGKENFTDYAGRQFVCSPLSLLELR